MGSDNHPPESSTNIDNTTANIIGDDWQSKVIDEEVRAKYIVNTERLRQELEKICLDDHN